MNAMVEGHGGNDSIIRAAGLAYVMFEVPDLERTRIFLLDFGFRDVEVTDGTLTMTGGSAPFLYRATKGAPRFAGLGFAAGMTDLATLSAATGCESVALDTPGGGRRVRLSDPDGFTIDVVAGQQTTAPSAELPAQSWNTLARRERVRLPKRIELRLAHVRRLGHCVLAVSDFARSEAWYKRHFGLLTSDAIRADAGGLMGAFMRCDLGETPTDHHTLFLAESPQGPAFRHAAFEVDDLDDLMAGHEYLTEKAHTAAWGVGRHILGSQVFDYWRDPWGFMFEHWTDGDVFTRSDAPNTVGRSALHEVQWGPDFPGPSFIASGRPEA